MNYTEKEKVMYETLLQIAQRDCAGFCGLIARKTIERIDQAAINLLCEQLTERKLEK